jgi:hypothetical protein
MKYYLNDKDLYDYDNLIEYLDEVDRHGIIGGETIVDANGNPFFTRCDYKLPSVISASPPATSYQCAQGSPPVCDFSGNIYYPIAFSSASIGILKINSNNLNESVILQHDTFPTTYGDTAGLLGGNFHCLTPNGMILSSTSGKSGTISNLVYIDTKLIDTLKLKSGAISPQDPPILSSYWGNPIYNKKHNCVYFTPHGDNFDSGDVWVRLNLNTTPFQIETYSFGYVINEFYSSKYNSGVHTRNNRIFLTPATINSTHTSVTKLHYIDCSGDNPVVVAYNIGTMISELYSSGECYRGGVYVPKLDRIYLIPYYQTRNANKKLHYIANCSTSPSVVSYTHTSTDIFSSSGAYQNGLYIGKGLIFMIPINQANRTKFHLIDTNNNNLISYNNFLSSTATPVVERVLSWFAGATLVGDKIVFSYKAGTKVTNQISWCYLNLNHNMPYSMQYTSHPLKLNS